MSFEGEKIFNSVKEIKYVYKPSKTDSEHLVVIFSAFNPRGSAPAYNYIRTLQSLDVNKLFILDDQGERGSYYLGQNRVFDAEASVISLITKTANENKIPHDNIITCGSSKGGYAALYFGIKYGFGHVIAGAPQTKLGSYLRLAAELQTFEFIAGDSSEESLEYLDGLLYDVVSNSKKVPDILIHVGLGDHHYKGHVLPFKRQLEANGFACLLDVKDYNDHGDVSHYQKLLVATIIEKVPSLKNSLRIDELYLDIDNFNLKTKTFTNKNALYAWYVYKNGERIHIEWYNNNNEFAYNTKAPGTYYVLAFAKDSEGFIVSEKTEEFVIE